MTDVDQTPSDEMSATGSVRADLVEPTRTGMQAAALQRAIDEKMAGERLSVRHGFMIILPLICRLSIMRSASAVFSSGNT